MHAREIHERSGTRLMWADAAAMQWSADFKALKPKLTNNEPGVIYMLAGATQRCDSDLTIRQVPPHSNRPALDEYVAV